MDNTTKLAAKEAGIEDILSDKYSLEEQVDVISLRLELVLQRQFAISHVLNLYTSDDRHHNAIVASTGRLLIDLWEDLDNLCKVLNEANKKSKRRTRISSRRFSKRHMKNKGQLKETL